VQPGDEVVLVQERGRVLLELLSDRLHPVSKPVRRRRGAEAAETVCRQDPGALWQGRQQPPDRVPLRTREPLGKAVPKRSVRPVELTSREPPVTHHETSAIVVPVVFATLIR